MNSLNQYKLTYNTGTTTHLLEFEGVFLEEILENFTLFLKGCGFYLDGLEIIDNSEEDSDGLK